MLSKAAKRRARRAKLTEARGYDMREIARLTGQAWSRDHGYHMGARREFVLYKHGINVHVSNIRGSGLGRIYGKTIGHLPPISGTVIDPYTWESDRMIGRRTRAWDMPIAPVIGLHMWDDRPMESGMVMRSVQAWHHDRIAHGELPNRDMGGGREFRDDNPRMPVYFGTYTPCRVGHALVECYCLR